MSYPSEISGLELFAAPFRSTRAFTSSSVSRPQQAKAKAPQPVKSNAAGTQAQKSDVAQPPVTDEKSSALQTKQDKATETAQKEKPQTKAPAPAKAQATADAKEQPSVKEQPTVQAQPEKELSLDMSDRSVPAGEPLDMSEDAKRKAHEEAEAKRKAEWDAKQAAQKKEEAAAIQKLEAMSDADAVTASTERVRTDVERLTRRSMKECVAEHIQSVCKNDPAFARRTMHPRKSMIHCFQYINRKAKDYIRQEMEDNDIKPENGVYGGDVPDDLCYQWGVDYFNDPDAQEDGIKEETYVPHPYTGAASKSKTKKSAKSNKPAKKEPKKKQELKSGYEQMTLGV